MSTQCIFRLGTYVNASKTVLGKKTSTLFLNMIK